MKKACMCVLLIAALLVCGACSNVRQAPVEDRLETDQATKFPAQPAADPAAAEQVGKRAGKQAGKQTGDQDNEQWVELPDPSGPADTSEPVESGPVSGNPAVIALMDDTEFNISQGNPEAAAGSLERALRLEPKNPWLWHRLAELKLGQGDWRQAVALAQKSNSLSADHPELRRANADLIKRAEKYE